MALRTVAAALLLSSGALAEIPTALITGVVVDESGQPVGGAGVHAFGREKSRAVTDNKGRFALALEGPTVSYSDLLATDGAGKRQGFWKIDDAFEKARDCRIVLHSTRQLRVRVKDEKGNGVLNAEVAVQYDYNAWVAGRTDAAGAVKLRVPGDVVIESTVAMKRGAGLDYVQRDQQLFLAASDSGSEQEVVLTLHGARRFTLQAKDSKGKLVEGVELIPWFLKAPERGQQINLSGPSLAAALPSLISKTDSNGESTVDWMPLNAVGSVPFLARGNDWHEPVPVMFDPGHPDAVLSVRLLRSVMLRGRVTQPDGTPAGGIIMQAEGRGDTFQYCRTQAQTAADGSFEMKVYPEQEYILSSLDKDWAAESITGLLIGEGEVLPEVPVRLGKGTLVHGRVMLAAIHRPYAGSIVTVIQHHWKGQLVRWAKADSEGRYEIRLGRGEYRITGPGAADEELVVAREEEVEKNFSLGK